MVYRMVKNSYLVKENGAPKLKEVLEYLCIEHEQWVSGACFSIFSRYISMSTRKVTEPFLQKLLKPDSLHLYD